MRPIERGAARRRYSIGRSRDEDSVSISCFDSTGTRASTWQIFGAIPCHDADMIAFDVRVPSKRAKTMCHVKSFCAMCQSVSRVKGYINCREANAGARRAP